MAEMVKRAIGGSSDHYPPPFLRGYLDRSHCCPHQPPIDFMNTATKMHFTLEKRLILAMAISFLLILLMCPKDTEARPDDSWVLYRDYLESMGALDDASKHSNKCKTSEETETLCQHCAKQTKSTLAYPMCCEDREGATEWCYKYVNYGRFPQK